MLGCLKDWGRIHLYFRGGAEPTCSIVKSRVGALVWKSGHVEECAAKGKACMWGWGGEGDGGMELRTVLWLHRVDVNAGGFCSITLSFACPFALSLPAMPTLRAGQGEKSDPPCKVRVMVLGSTEDSCQGWDGWPQVSPLKWRLCFHDSWRNHKTDVNGLGGGSGPWL